MNTVFKPKLRSLETTSAAGVAAFSAVKSAANAPLVFAAEVSKPPIATAQAPWNILVVDDEPDVHAATQFALRDFHLDGRAIAITSASSAAEAIALLHRRQDFALILLDVVMETEHAGLDVVRHVRQVQANKLVRIVLRTGQPGQSPERDVVIDYDINDYKDKADMTAQRLITCVVSALRAYRDLQNLDDSRTALKQAQTDLQEALAAQERLVRQRSDMLVHAEKLASVGQLAAGVAHEINTPMAYVSANLGALRAYVGDLFQLLDATTAALPPTAVLPALKQLQATVDAEFLRKDIANLLTESSTGAARVRKIVGDLREFSQIDRPKTWQRFNLHLGLDAAASLLAPELHATTLVKAYGDLPEIECQPGELNQVFLSLLLNAAQAMPQSPPGRITVRTGSDGAWVWVEVADTGAGIPSAVLPRIFEPFFTTKAVGVGTGLGLSMAYGVVRKHGGEIAASSVLGEGTVMRVRLPVSRVATPGPEPEADPQRGGDEHAV